MAVIGEDMPPIWQMNDALALLSHRGPDGCGTWSNRNVWLGHRRLSIIDLSDAGSQPMHASDVVSVTFNGEIYNYLELRRTLVAKGHRFRSATDTEVLLRAYLEWGVACLEKLNGMWAFVLWDSRTATAFIARDRFGVKPLYYSHRPHRVIIASEPKAIVALQPELRAVDDGTLFRLLGKNELDQSDRTFYKGVFSLPPGHYALLKPQCNSIIPRPYWFFPSTAPTTRGGDTMADIGALLEDAVRLRLRSDVRVGITLSGGLDSTAILEAVRAVDPVSEISAFTSVYRNSLTMDEGNWARGAVARHPGVRLNEVDANENKWLSNLEQIVWHMDGPGLSPAVFPLWEIMKSAKAAGVSVLLEGQGADEMFGGYAAHAALAALGEVSRALRHPRMEAIMGAGVSIRTVTSAHSIRRILADIILAAFPGATLARDWRAGVRRTLRPDFVESAIRSLPKENRLRPLEFQVESRLLQDFTRRTLPGFLHYGDAISMAHSVESRLPFLDYRLVEFAFSMSSAEKVVLGRTKEPVRRYLHSVGQHSIGERMDKRGYPTPAPEWMRRNDGAILRDVLLDRDAVVRDYVNMDALKRTIGAAIAGQASSNDQLYGLLTTEIWLKRCIRQIV